MSLARSNRPVIIHQYENAFGELTYQLEDGRHILADDYDSANWDPDEIQPFGIYHLLGDITEEIEDSINNDKIQF